MGSLGSTLRDIRDFVASQIPGKPGPWTTAQIPDLTGKICLVTGGNAGIGQETVKALLEHNAKVYLAARSPAKAETAIKELQQSTGKEAIFLQLDLADLKSIKKAAEEFCAKETELHILYNNAGVMNTPMDQLTADGYDMQFGTNVLGHFYLTKLLLPALIAAAKSSTPGTVRVVNTSSAGHYMPGSSLNFATFKDGPRRRKVDKSVLYAQSKFGNVVFAKELARRYGDEGIVSTAVHPGVIRSDLWQHSPLLARICSMMMYAPAEGALTQLWGGTSPEGATPKWQVPYHLGERGTSKGRHERSAGREGTVDLVRGTSEGYLRLRVDEAIVEYTPGYRLGWKV